jgi:hypothetical protein
MHAECSWEKIVGGCICVGYRETGCEWTGLYGLGIVSNDGLKLAVLSFLALFSIRFQNWHFPYFEIQLSSIPATSYIPVFYVYAVAC